MAYIIAVNSLILTDSGATCGCAPRTPQECLSDPAYEQCVSEIRHDFITATAASASIACILMGMFANLPFALAPGLGLNAYFAYQVVGFHGSGKIPYKTALVAVLIEGLVFMVLSLFS